MKRRNLACGALAGLAVLAPISAAAAKPAAGPHRVGVVVDYRLASHTATLALPGGRLIALHTAKHVRPGARVRLAKLTQLANGTYTGTLRATGRARRARVRATVVAHLGSRAIAVSARGTTFTVRLARPTHRRSAKRANEVGSGPAVGTISTVVAIGAGGRLRCGTIKQLAPPDASTAIDIEGRISAIDDASRTLTVTTEDDGLSADFAVIVPDTIDISAYAVGDEIEGSVIANPDGTFTLQGSSLNGDDQEADDTSGDQGDQPAEGDVTANDGQHGGSGGNASEGDSSGANHSGGDHSEGDRSEGDHSDSQAPPSGGLL